MPDGFMALCIAAGLTRREAERVWERYRMTNAGGDAAVDFRMACAEADVTPALPEGW